MNARGRPQHAATVQCVATRTRVQTQQIHGKAATANALLRKHVLEHVVPAVASLKGSLEEARHPLQRQALHCLVRCMLEHKEHMEEVLVTQLQLAAEIKFHAQEMQKAANKRHKQQAGASARLSGPASEMGVAAPTSMMAQLPVAPSAPPSWQL
jgi:hypothetical protein